MDIFVRNPKSSSLSYRWRKECLPNSGPCDHQKAALLGGEMVVPKGFLAVYVGEDMKRFVIPTKYLCLPVFKEMMENAAEMFGYKHEGGLRIPCDEEVFEETLKMLEEMRMRRKKEKKESKGRQKAENKECKKKKKKIFFFLKIC